MSGGYYDYAFGHINTLASNIDWDIARHSQGGVDQEFSEDVLSRMTDLRHDLERIAKQAHALEWFMSDDTGEEAFIKRFDEAAGEKR